MENPSSSSEGNGGSGGGGRVPGAQSGCKFLTKRAEEAEAFREEGVGREEIQTGGQIKNSHL